VIRALLVFARAVISSSVMPSAKYSSSVAPDKFSRGMTARAVISDVGCERLLIQFRTPPTLARMIVTRQVTAAKATVQGWKRARLCVSRGGTDGTCAASGVMDATKRYPLRGRVSMNCGRSAESPSASRKCRTALFRPRSKSTNVPSGQSRRTRASRVTSSPGRSKRQATTSGADPEAATFCPRSIVLRFEHSARTPRNGRNSCRKKHFPYITPISWLRSLPLTFSAEHCPFSSELTHS
jgi:hypothetical protein